MNFRCLSVIIPVFNEVQTFRRVLDKVKSVPVPKEIIIVDDFSTDGSRDLLRTIQNEGDKTVKVFFQEKNQGKGAALREGIKHATGDILIIQDADMEYDPNDYPALIQPISDGRAEVVFGSRFLDKKIAPGKFFHTMVNKFLTGFSNLCTGQNITDMETCYKVFKTEIIQKMILRSNRFGFEPEVTAKIAKQGYKIFEVPISYYGRSYEEGKKINWKDGVSALWTIIKYSFF